MPLAAAGNAELSWAAAGFGRSRFSQRPEAHWRESRMPTAFARPSGCSGLLDSELSDGDRVTFISTLHGG